MTKDIANSYYYRRIFGTMTVVTVLLIALLVWLIEAQSTQSIETLRHTLIGYVIIMMIILLVCGFVFVMAIRHSLDRTLENIGELLTNPSQESFDKIRDSNDQCALVALEWAEDYANQKARHNELGRAMDATAIVSTTDTKGMITYANEEFCRISGYGLDELLGHSHNIVRHPDSPKEIFTDLWKTIVKGEIWTGMIINRAKNGSRYYVRSTIIPIHDAHGVVYEYLAIRHDITSAIEQMYLIKEQTTDALTGLPNQAKLVQDIPHVIDPKLAFLNIDRFRDINDSYGHLMGDELLKMIAERLKMFQTEQVRIYRTKADEFAMLVDETMSEEQFVGQCQMILAMLMYGQIDVGDVSIPLSVRIGAASGQERLMMKVEQAVSQARDERKNFLFYDHSYDFTSRIEERLEWTKRIVATLEEDRFEIFGQPIINVANPQEKKYECLLRMREGDQIFGPYMFMDHAKQAKLYEKLTIQVIRKALAHFGQHEGEFSINMTMDDISNSMITHYLFERLDQSGLAERLIVEIVESENMVDLERVKEFIDKLHARGARIAIDDFGSGYSNFDYLLKMNADFIKLDGSLIKSIDSDTNAKLLVQTIVEFSKTAGMKTIAEYVHSQAVMDVCVSLGIDYLQGFYLGVPTPLNELD